MAVIIGTKEEVKEYFETASLNQSTLKELENGLGAFLSSVYKREKEKQENKATPEHFLIGGAVDLILTGEEGEFDKAYHVSRLSKKPSEAEITIISHVFHELEVAGVVKDMEFQHCENSILDAANEYAWQPRWKDETRVAKLIEAGTAYFEDMKEALGKDILTVEQYEKITNIVNSLRTNWRTSKFFDRADMEEMPNIDFYYQLPIYFEIDGLPCKALMDFVVVIKSNKGEILNISPYDLKTMSGNTIGFLSSLKQRRYDIQAAWYTRALQHHFKTDKISRFRFIVESTTSVGNPLVFEINDATLKHGNEGSPQKEIKALDGQIIVYRAEKGINQLIEDYLYYQEQGFEEDKVTEGQAVLELDWVKGIL